MIILIYSVCIVSIFIFVFLGAILVVYNLKKEISIIEKTNNSEDQKNLREETTHEERPQIEIVPAETSVSKLEVLKAVRKKMFNQYSSLDLIGKKTILDLMSERNKIMSKNNSEDYNVLEEKELNSEKRP